MYPDPETFNPDRFLKDGKINPDVRDPNTFVFGYGRRYVHHRHIRPSFMSDSVPPLALPNIVHTSTYRICPGKFFADSTLFLTMASILHVFDIAAPLDSNGYPIPQTFKLVSAVMSYAEFS